MTPTAIVLASVALGVVVGSFVTAGIIAARAAGQRRSAALRPNLPDVAVEILGCLDSFAVILDASLAVVYANAAARDESHVGGEELRDPEFLKRARQVMITGVPDTRLPDPNDPSDTTRVQIIRIHPRFLAVIAVDLGQEQRVNAMRRDFIANVSHELKTPIAAIGLLSEAVLEGSTEPQIVESFARKLIKEARRLGDLSRDIIQLSEAQSDLKPEDKEPVSLRAVMRTEVEAHRDFASQHNVSLVVTDLSDTQDDPVTLGRPSSVGIVIANLLSNAIRHSPENGRVGVGIERTKRTCTITVTDQGEGIDAEHLPRIFERFYRVDTARSREAGGTGLGLSIARHTMRAHGGEIEVWSQVGLGSTFTLTFPLIDAEGEKKSKRKRKRAVPPDSEPRSSLQRTNRKGYVK